MRQSDGAENHKKGSQCWFSVLGMLGFPEVPLYKANLTRFFPFWKQDFEGLSPSGATILQRNHRVINLRAPDSGEKMGDTFAAGVGGCNCSVSLGADSWGTGILWLWNASALAYSEALARVNLRQ